ncbi:hypothetical protein F5Y12DRAFT_732989 [Xylaria sp. FL1777]|nr:hypothetical protein F5Y12DRAFT_732989 [Xylaria sp. FL1777]
MTMVNIATTHGELISVLLELYTLLTGLGAVPAENLYLPDPNTGTHPTGALNTAAAAAAGFAPEAVQLMNALPYLTADRHEMYVELLGSTYPVTYLGEDLDEGYFLGSRELLNDVEMTPTAVQLTWSEIYGTVFIYDTATKLLTPWVPFESPDEVDDYSHLAGASPREVLSPIIDNYRKLRYLASPMGVDWADRLYAGSGGVRPDGWGAHEQGMWEASYAVWEATMKLRDLYLECGWDVDAVEQRSFSLDEFLARRDVYWKDVVEPLLEAQDRAREDTYLRDL